MSNKVGVEDLKRLFAEIGRNNEKLETEDKARQWLEMHGLEEEIGDFLAEQAKRFFFYSIVQLDDEGHGVAILDGDTLGSICSALLFGGMTLGWEMHTSFGPPPTDLSGLDFAEAEAEQDAPDT